MSEPFAVSAHASAKNIEVWAQNQSWKTKIESKPGQDGQTVLYARKMGTFEAIFHRTTKSERVSAAKDLVAQALKTDKPIVQRGGATKADRLWTAPGFKEIPESLRQSSDFQSAARALGKALQGKDPNSLAAAAGTMAKVLGEGLGKEPFSVQMKFALADSKSMLNVLLPYISVMTHESDKKSGVSSPPPPTSVTGLDPLQSQLLMPMYDGAVSRLSDHQASPTQIVVAGKVYQKAESLGSGAFGAVNLYRADGPYPLESGIPYTLAVKAPTVAPDAADFRQAAINNPLREARALVNGVGTGGAELGGNVAKFHTALRGVNGEVLLAMRVEEGASTKKAYASALKGLKSTDPQESLTPKQFESLTLTLFKDALQGAMRLHEGAGLIHYDLKPDNWLIGADGQVKIADPGASRTPGDASLDRADGFNMVPVPYSAPEAFIVSTNPKTAASDVWTLGIALFEMAALRGPMSMMNPARHPLAQGAPGMSFPVLRQKLLEFGNNPNNVMLRKELIQPGSFLEKCEPLINAMLHPVPSKRPTLEQVLAHPLLNQAGIGGSEVRELIQSFAKPDPVPAAPVVAAPVQAQAAAVGPPQVQAPAQAIAPQVDVPVPYAVSAQQPSAAYGVPIHHDDSEEDEESSIEAEDLQASRPGFYDSLSDPSEAYDFVTGDGLRDEEEPDPLRGSTGYGYV